MGEKKAPSLGTAKQQTQPVFIFRVKYAAVFQAIKENILPQKC